MCNPYKYLFWHTVIILLIIFPFHKVASQIFYHPLHSETVDFAQIKETLSEKLKSDLASLSSYKKDISDIYRQRHDNLIHRINEGHFISDKQVNSYFNEIFNEIINANPDIKKSTTRLLISRNIWPNASCLGEGTIILNIGLVRRLKHPGQLAFILSHELAHHSLNHVNTAIAQTVATLNAKDKKLKKAAKSKYGSKTKVAEILKEVIYKGRMHGREHEKEADSLAIHYLHNTHFGLHHGIRSLEILDIVDSEKYYDNISLKTTFHSSRYPFKNKWLATEKGLSFGFDNTTQLNLDSLKSHPDCQKRIGWVKQEIEKLNIEKNEYITENTRSSQFKNIVTTCDFEIIESEYLFKKYGNCLYLTLLMLNKFPKSPYLHSMVGKCLYRIYQAQKKHELTTYVDLPSPYYKEQYNKVLNFIHNLRLSEIARVSYEYMQKHAESYMKNEEFLYVLILSCQMTNKTDEIAHLKRKYQDQFTNGKYISIINQY